MRAEAGDCGRRGGNGGRLRRRPFYTTVAQAISCGRSRSSRYSASGSGASNSGHHLGCHDGGRSPVMSIFYGGGGAARLRARAGTFSAFCFSAAVRCAGPKTEMSTAWSGCALSHVSCAIRHASAHGPRGGNGLAQFAIGWRNFPPSYNGRWQLNLASFSSPSVRAAGPRPTFAKHGEPARRRSGRGCPMSFRPSEIRGRCWSFRHCHQNCQYQGEPPCQPPPADS